MTHPAPQKPTRPPMPFWAKAVAWGIATVIAGLLGGQGGEWMFPGAYWFGFLVSLVLTGLSGLFALAVHVANSQK